MDAADVALVNTDNDGAGINVSPVAGLVTSEAGGQASFTVVLNSQPTADVVIPVASNNAAEGVASAASLTGSASGWEGAQTSAVTGAVKKEQDGDIAYGIVLAAAASSDAIYAGMAAADVALVNTDNDAAGITVAPVAGLATSEAGTQASFTVVLNSQPTADVVIPVASNNAAEGVASVAS